MGKARGDGGGHGMASAIPDRGPGWGETGANRGLHGGREGSAGKPFSGASLLQALLGAKGRRAGRGDKPVDCDKPLIWNAKCR